MSHRIGHTQFIFDIIDIIPAKLERGEGVNLLLSKRPYNGGNLLGVPVVSLLHTGEELRTHDRVAIVT